MLTCGLGDGMELVSEVEQVTAQVRLSELMYKEGMGWGEWEREVTLNGHVKTWMVDEWMDDGDG